MIFVQSCRSALNLCPHCLEPAPAAALKMLIDVWDSCLEAEWVRFRGWNATIRHVWNRVTTLHKPAAADFMWLQLQKNQCRTKWDILCRNGQLLVWKVWWRDCFSKVQTVFLSEMKSCSFCLDIIETNALSPDHDFLYFLHHEQNLNVCFHHGSVCTIPMYFYTIILYA